MRTLTGKEITTIKKSIIRKDIVVAEILSEVYDHYITHLENEPQEVFEKEIYRLDEKFTQEYCKRLQYQSRKSVKQNIYKLQKLIFKSYFSWPRFAFSLIFIGLISYLSTLLPFNAQVLTFVMTPLVFILGLSVMVQIRTRTKLKSLRSDFSDQSLRISSIMSDTISSQLHWPITLINIALHIPRIFGWTDFVPEYLYSLLSVSTCILLVFHGLVLLEILQIKSKTALI